MIDTSPGNRFLKTLNGVEWVVHERVTTERANKEDVVILVMMTAKGKKHIMNEKDFGCFFKYNVNEHNHKGLLIK